jgi:hypothetical protein
MPKKFVTFDFVNPCILAAEVTWGLHNLRREWRHINLRNRLQRALPCCTEN